MRQVAMAKHKLADQMSDRYDVECGSLKRTIASCCCDHALIEAFKKWPPKTTSLLARVRLVGSVWAYIDPVPSLRKAGYKVTLRCEGRTATGLEP